MAKKKPIIIKLNQLEASILTRVVQDIADVIEHGAEQELRPLTAHEDLQIDIFSHIYTQILGQEDKMDPIEIANLWTEYEKDYIKDSEDRAKLN
tara:strand:+ start:403 stop:684 length:282 start_codon:yes stop_codon:yes gene_type:complete